MQSRENRVGLPNSIADLCVNIPMAHPLNLAMPRS